jgi:glutamyl-tRNA synthetase
MHLGNVRTALFNSLLARSAGGQFVLRIEDTDVQRSDEAHRQGIIDDLGWLGLEWDEGPGKGDGRSSFLQSERAAVYEELLARLQERGFVYPCWRTAEELKGFRAERMAAGRPPVYDRDWGRLDDSEIRARGEAGQRPALRFRVPGQGATTFKDLVRGPQRFGLADIGDFVVRRADGSSAFFFVNAVDDGLMGITHVLRGEDHLSNTPRQILILEALDLPVPQYGHLPMLLGPDGSPLSKRSGSASLADLRKAGFMPAAIVNYIARLGHAFDTGEFMDMAGLAAHFDLERIGRAPAHFDREQLRHWQSLAVHHCDPGTLESWAGESAMKAVPAEHRDGFLALVQPNILFPADVAVWAAVLFDQGLEFGAEVGEQLSAAGPDFFAACLQAHQAGADLKSMAAAVREATGARGREFFMPLRLALTGLDHGPELGPLLSLMPPEVARERLRRQAETASAHEETP